MMEIAATSSMAMADTIVRLSRIDKVLVINLGSRNMRWQRYEINSKTLSHFVKIVLYDDYFMNLQLVLCPFASETAAT